MTFFVLLAIIVEGFITLILRSALIYQGKKEGLDQVIKIAEQSAKTAPDLNLIYCCQADCLSLWLQ